MLNEDEIKHLNNQDKDIQRKAKVEVFDRFNQTSYSDHVVEILEEMITYQEKDRINIEKLKFKMNLLII